MKVLNLDTEGIHDETEEGFTGYHGGPREDNEDEDIEGDDNDQAGDLEGK